MENYDYQMKQLEEIHDALLTDKLDKNGSEAIAKFIVDYIQ